MKIYNDCEDSWDFDLLIASAVGDEFSVKNLLVEPSPDPTLKTLRNSKGWTPIMFAAYFGHSKIVSILMADKAFDVRDKNDKGFNQYF